MGRVIKWIGIIVIIGIIVVISHTVFGDLSAPVAEVVKEVTINVD